MRFFKIMVCLCVMLTLFYGCSSKKRVEIAQKQLPSWYTKPMKTNDTTLYAVAQGENRADAIANALSEILASLSVSISSDFHTQSIVKEGSVESMQNTTVSDIKTRVEKIRINNYEVTEFSDFSFERYLVAVAIDKKTLFEGLQKDLEQKFLNLKNQNKDAKNYHALKELAIYKKSLLALEDAQSTLAVMHSLDASFDDAHFRQKMQAMQNKYEHLISKISFSIESNPDANNLKSAIKKGLSLKKYTINNTKDKNHFSIFISSKTSKAKSYGFDLARSAIAITVKDYKGNIIGSNKLNITGQSSQAYTIAKENVAMKLHAMISEVGISKILGIDI